MVTGDAQKHACSSFVLKRCTAYRLLDACPMSYTIFPTPCQHMHTQVSRKYGLSRAPKLVEMIAAVPEEHRAMLLPQLRAKPVRTASGIAVVAVMSKPHRCPHIATTGVLLAPQASGVDAVLPVSIQMQLVQQLHQHHNKSFAKPTFRTRKRWRCYSFPAGQKKPAACLSHCPAAASLVAAAVVNAAACRQHLHLLSWWA